MTGPEIFSELAEWCRVRGITPEELLRLSSPTPTRMTVYNWRTGRTTPPPAAQRRIRRLMAEYDRVTTTIPGDNV